MRVHSPASPRRRRGVWQSSTFTAANRPRRFARLCNVSSNPPVVLATGGDLASFATPGRLASYAGLVPVPRDSGRVSGNLHRPKRSNRRLRRVFYMAALSSIRANGPSRQFYDRKRGERLIQSQALL